jgi:hypothetical protein
MVKGTIKKALRLIFGLGIICVIIWAILNNKGYNYDPRDASSTKSVADEIEYKNKLQFEYENSLEGKYENGETDTVITDDGDIVIFFVATDTIKNNKKR